MALEGAKTEEWPTVEGLIEVGDPEMAVEVKAAEEAGMKAEEEVAERLAKAELIFAFAQLREEGTN